MGSILQRGCVDSGWVVHWDWRRGDHGCRIVLEAMRKVKDSRPARPAHTFSACRCLAKSVWLGRLVQGALPPNRSRTVRACGRWHRLIPPTLRRMTKRRTLREAPSDNLLESGVDDGIGETRRSLLELPRKPYSKRAVGPHYNGGPAVSPRGPRCSATLDPLQG